jgi:hypothetical protein
MSASKTCVALFNLIPQGVDLTGTFTKLALTCKPNKSPEINVKLSVQNLGQLATSKTFLFNVDFFLSSDGVVDGGDTLLLTQPVQKAIKAGKSFNISKKFKPAIACPTGQQVLAQIDPLNGVSEINEANNLVLSPTLALPAAASLVTIPFGLGEALPNEQRTIQIYDLKGHKLIQQTSAGALQLTDAEARKLASGVYLCVLIVRGADGKLVLSEIKKLVLQK